MNFSVTYHRSYKVVSVRDAAGAGPVERYVLVQCGAPAPTLAGELAGAQVATVPISSLYSASPTHLSMLVDLRRLDVLTGVSQMKQLIGEEILERVKSGQVREFAPLSVIDAELVVSQRPGLFMTGGTASAPLAVIRSAGIPGRKEQRLAGADCARAGRVAEVRGALSERRTTCATALR